MKTLRLVVLPVLVATVWVAASEFLRNELLFKSCWVDHYASMGLVFPSEPINGAIWGVWSLFFATAAYIVTRRFRLLEAFGIMWLVGFVLMWIVVGNMGVLPFSLLWFAVPLSLLEAFLAVFIVDRLGRN